MAARCAGSSWTGRWHKGKRHGPGTLVYADGAEQTGTWVNDLYVDPGSSDERSAVVSMRLQAKLAEKRKAAKAAAPGAAGAGGAGGAGGVGAGGAAGAGKAGDDAVATAAATAAAEAERRRKADKALAELLAEARAHTPFCADTHTHTHLL